MGRHLDVGNGMESEWDAALGIGVFDLQFYWDRAQLHFVDLLQNGDAPGPATMDDSVSHGAAIFQGALATRKDEQFVGATDKEELLGDEDGQDKAESYAYS